MLNVLIIVKILYVSWLLTNLYIMKKKLEIYSVEFHSFEFPQDSGTIAYFQDKVEAFKYMAKLVEDKTVKFYDNVKEMNEDHPTNIKLPNCIKGKPAIFFNNCFQYPLAYYINSITVN